MPQINDSASQELKTLQDPRNLSPQDASERRDFKSLSNPLAIKRREDITIFNIQEASKSRPQSETAPQNFQKRYERRCKTLQADLNIFKVRR
jgi:hypothetical protein